MRTIDTLINARWIVPVEPAGPALEHFSLAIDQGDILELLPTADSARRYQARETVDLPRHVIIPGLINAHTHSPMSLFRGLADDLPLMDWLNHHIWPAEAKWVGPEFVRDGTNLAMAEMLKSGTTCFSDMYFFADDTAHAALAAGMRAVIGLILVDFPSGYAATPDEYLHKGIQLHDTLKHNRLVKTAFAPHAPYTVSDAPLERLRLYADELDIPVHMHVHETAHEVDGAVAQSGMRPIARLDRLGLFGPRLIAVHMTQLQPAEIENAARLNVSVAHCPESNLKLASGFCPVAKLLKAGVNVALGTDGAASNNDLDMLGELRTAALLAKGTSGEATALPAHQALAMATINGARALGLDEITGSLTPGKSADLTAIDLSGIASQPVYDPVSQIVYTATRDQVTDVWVAGKHLLADRKLTTLDEDALLRKAQEWRNKIK
jgi:5-methylthioadenosine/S-adenosylhomocysteine deaminase